MSRLDPHYCCDYDAGVVNAWVQERECSVLKKIGGFCRLAAASERFLQEVAVEENTFITLFYVPVTVSKREGQNSSQRRPPSGII